MGKLSSYVWTEVLCSEGLHNYYGLSRKGWYRLSKVTYDKLRLHLMYSFEDRNDTGYLIGDLIWYLENINHGYPFMLKILKRVTKAEFEGYTPYTVSRSMLIYLMGIDFRNIDTWNFQRNGSFNKRYYCKKFKKFIKDFELNLQGGIYSNYGDK
jgi:hypothetical protein